MMIYGEENFTIKVALKVERQTLLPGRFQFGGGWLPVRRRLVSYRLILRLRRRQIGEQRQAFHKRL